MSKRSEVQVDQKDVFVLTPKNVQVFNVIFFIQHLILSYMHILKRKKKRISFAACPFEIILVNMFG